MTLTFDGGRAEIFPAREEARLALWVFAESGEAERLAREMDGRTALFALSGEDWNRDLSPWAAPACFRGGDDFAGEGPAYLRRLARDVFPRAEALAGLPAGCPRAMAGYSLAGLFALWALLETDLFAGAASASGSLWFDGFDDYLVRSAARAAGKAVCLSLGDAEPRTRNRRLACVEERTVLAEDLLRAAGARVAAQRNPGNHFNDPEGRLLRACRALRDLLA